MQIIKSNSSTHFHSLRAPHNTLQSIQSSSIRFNSIQFNSLPYFTLRRMQRKTGSEKNITLVGFQLVPEHEVPRLSPCVTINFHMIQSIIAYIWTPVVIAEGKVVDYYNTRDALRPLAKICHEACRYFITQIPLAVMDGPSHDYAIFIPFMLPSISSVYRLSSTYPTIHRSVPIMIIFVADNAHIDQVQRGKVTLLARSRW